MLDGFRRYVPAIVGASAGVAVEAGQELTRLGEEFAQFFGPGDINDVYASLLAGGVAAYTLHRKK